MEYHEMESQFICHIIIYQIIWFKHPVCVSKKLSDVMCSLINAQISQGLRALDLYLYTKY